MGTCAASSGEALAVVRDLSVTYADDSASTVRALSRASIEIRAGEFLGILGESGSGKSTLGAALLRLLPGHGRYDRGSITFLGRDLLKLDEPDLQQIRGAEIALIPQDPALALNPVMCAGAQIAEVLLAHTPVRGPELRKRVEELLAEVGFQRPVEIYSAYPHQLSGGQRQRIAITQAMACRPKLVIADEPTSKLDASLQIEILSLMREISSRHQTAFILISHDPAVLAGFVERIAVMYAGCIVEEGRTEDIFQRPLHPYTQALVRLSGRYLFGEGNRTRFSMIAGEQTRTPGVTAGCPFAPSCPERMPVCGERDPVEISPQPMHRVSCFKYGE